MAAEQQVGLVRPGRRGRHGDLDGGSGRAAARTPGQETARAGGVGGVTWRLLGRGVATSG